MSSWSAPTDACTPCSWRSELWFFQRMFLRGPCLSRLGTVVFACFHRRVSSLTAEKKLPGWDLETRGFPPFRKDRRKGNERDRLKGKGSFEPATSPERRTCQNRRGAVDDVAAVVLRPRTDAMAQEERDKYAQYAYKAVRERAGGEAREKTTRKRRQADFVADETGSLDLCTTCRMQASCWPPKEDVDRPNPQEKLSLCVGRSMPKPWEIAWHAKGRKSSKNDSKRRERNGEEERWDACTGDQRNNGENETKEVRTCL